MIDVACPRCGSSRVRRGGTKTWTVYVILLILGIPAVLLLHLDAAIVGGVMLAVIVIANLLLNERVCSECGTQWRPRG